MIAAPQPQQQKLAAPPPLSRMRLDKLVKGRLKQHVRSVLYGPEGVGKTTFGAGAPAPIFLGAEEGSAMLDVVRFPTPQSWADVLEAIRVLTVEPHEYRTLVVDTLDWIEPLIWAHICRRDEQSNIEGYGYGKGYQVALDEWRVFLNRLEGLRAAKPVHLVLLAHAWIKPFKNPAGEDYDRYELKIHNKAAGLVKEWSDAVLFANWETYAKKDERKRVRGVSTGARLIYTERTAAYDAKNRYNLPGELPLSWSDFESAMDAGQVAPAEDLCAEITRKAKELGGDLEKTILATLEKAKDAASLALINNRVNARLAERAASNPAGLTAEKVS
jgi:hypothetical protein